MAVWRIDLLDVRFYVGKESDVGFIYVHLRSGNEISNKKTAQRGCREYLDGTALLGEGLVCVIGPGTIRAADSSYPIDNVFYRIMQPPITDEPGALYYCQGPQFKSLLLTIAIPQRHDLCLEGNGLDQARAPDQSTPGLCC